MKKIFGIVFVMVLGCFLCTSLEARRCRSNFNLSFNVVTPKPVAPTPVVYAPPVVYYYPQVQQVQPIIMQPMQPVVIYKPVVYRRQPRVAVSYRWYN